LFEQTFKNIDDILYHSIGDYPNISYSQISENNHIGDINSMGDHKDRPNLTQNPRTGESCIRLNEDRPTKRDIIL